MRRIFLLVLATFLVAGCGAVPVPSSAAKSDGHQSTSQPPIAAGQSVPVPGSTGTDPAVDAAAFLGQGKLAFVWNGLLYVLEGNSGKLTRLTESGYVSNPAWSPDGRWLAYYHRSDPNGPLAPRVKKADGTQAISFAEADPNLGPFAWSPVSSVLAVVSDQGIMLVAPSKPHSIVQTGGKRVGLGAWSPDGKQLAYGDTIAGATPPPTDVLYTIPVDGGSPILRYTAPNQAGIRVVGWWPDGGGLIFQIVPMHSNSLAADGMSVQSLAIGSERPRELATMVGYSDWLAWAPDGRRLLVVVGGGRQAWQNKVLGLCDVKNGSCTTLEQPEGTVSIDPAWSPAGDQIAFVRADAARDAGGPGLIDQWVPTRKLWVSAPDGSGARNLPAAGSGVFGPAWSGDGRSLLFMRDNTVWLTGTEPGATPIKVLGPFPTKPDLFGYYGHVNVWNLMAWYRGRP